MRVYAKCLGAYLTGWLIVQPLYNRLFAAWRRRELRNPRGETQEYFRQQARVFIEQLHTYKMGGQEPPVALDVVVAQHTEIERLKGELDWRAEEIERLKGVVHEAGLDRK